MKIIIDETNGTEKHRLACEVATWKRLIKKNGLGWWTQTKEKIKAKRGQAGLNYLLSEMNRDRENKPTE